MIALIGFMGAGKTTVGRVLAGRLGLPFVDTDRRVEARAGATIHELFERGGEAAFRAIERDVVAEVLGAEDAVVALGGGAVTDPVTCSALEWATVVYLDVGFGEALRRIGDDRTRPLLSAGDPKALYRERQEIYRRLADHTVSSDGKTVAEVVDVVAALVGGDDTARARRVRVALGSNGYDVVVGRDLCADAGRWFPGARAEKAMVVTHPSLKAHAETLMSSISAAVDEVHVVDLAEGEASKSLAAVEALYDSLSELGFHRSDLLIAFGGGVVTDVAGFVASTYHRGMALVNVPTTLLGQVDAAIGGKNGVNMPAGKNLIGTIYQPRVVLCDVSLIASLPAEEVSSGMAEVVKYGLVSDPSLLDLIRENAQRIAARDASVLEEVVSRCAAVKAEIVAADERDAGRRNVLNYGHTFAHAIEHAAGFADVRHGEAVALGMMAAAYLARELGLLDDAAVDLHRDSLRAQGLPTAATLDLAALERAWAHDKKYEKGVRFVLLERIGLPRIGMKAPRPALEASLRALSR